MPFVLMRSNIDSNYEIDKEKIVVISIEEYVLNRVKVIVDYYVKENKEINPSTLKELIEQWSFDYEMEKKYRPEVLKKK